MKAKRKIRMKILILGGAGFIGNNLVSFFAQKNFVSVESTYFETPPKEVPGVKWHKVDLRNYESLTKLITDQDIVIQAAATTSGMAEIATRIDFHITDNVIMNANILRRVHQSKVKHFIFFSCTTMLKSSLEAQSEDDYSESDEIFPRYFGVGWTKVYIEKLCEYYSRSKKEIKYSVIRHSNIYGPGDKFHPQKSHVMAATIHKVLSESNRVVIWGKGKEFRDVLYIDDLVELVDVIISKQKASYSLVNCGGGGFLSTLELTKLVMTIANKTELKIEFDLNKPTVDFSVRVDYGLATKLFGWTPKTPIEEGIRKTIQYWKMRKKLEPNWPIYNDFNF